MVLAGKYMERRAKRQTTQALSELMALRPQHARIRRGAEVARIDVDDVLAGDIVVVRPGERIPIDGEILAGETDVDEQLLTGESLPVRRTAGDQVTVVV